MVENSSNKHPEIPFDYTSFGPVKNGEVLYPGDTLAQLKLSLNKLVKHYENNKLDRNSINAIWAIHDEDNEEMIRSILEGYLNNTNAKLYIQKTCLDFCPDIQGIKIILEVLSLKDSND